MPATYTVDASVFVNAVNPREAGYGDSHRILELMQENAVPIIVPTLVLPEVAAAISRGHGDPTLAHRFVSVLSEIPHLILVPMDTPLARRAADLAAQHRLRGGDAVYAAVALRFGSVLVTLDEQLRERAAQAVPTRSPAQALSEWRTL